MKKPYRAIFFDLDGTLLPMDMDVFVRGYFSLLADCFAPRGLSKKALLNAVMLGTRAMIENDGTMTNADRFWARFSALMGEDAMRLVGDFDRFYTTEFEKARAFTAPNPKAVEAIAAAHEKADLVVLSTNPLFPLCGITTRLSWVGLSESDFDYITTYENASFCKPNADYFRELLQKLDLAPQQVLMIGNDVQEDALAASSAGISPYLVTDCLLTHGLNAEAYPCGSFSDMIQMLKNL